MARRPLRVGLTGGIATGKSYCLGRFEQLGAPVIDADVLARAVVAPGTAGFAEVVRHFGPEVVANGTLDRHALGRLVFADPAARHALEAIVHPRVYAATASWYDALERAGHARFAVADVPLLYETGHEREFDLVVVAACRADLQRARLMARDGLTEIEADRRIAAQLPIDVKRARADYVIDTNGSTVETDAAVAGVFARIDALAGDL